MNEWNPRTCNNGDGKGKQNKACSAFSKNDFLFCSDFVRANYYCRSFSFRQLWLHTSSQYLIYETETTASSSH
jgi:hypothetical protein